VQVYDKLFRKYTSSAIVCQRVQGVLLSVIWEFVCQAVASLTLGISLSKAQSW